MQRRRNLAAPIHKLPIEVMVMIFAAYSKSSPLAYYPSLLDLTTVNKLWYDAIVYSPQLWTVLESDFSPKIAKLVIERSKALPLSLVWHDKERNEQEEQELERFLALVVQHSHRFKSINMIFPEWENLIGRELLQSKLPRLEKLRVKALWDSTLEEQLVKFELQNGPPLREIALDTVFLASWSSPRLIGLFALDLTGPIQSPSVEELLDILSNSPQLERLRLCDLDCSGSSWKRPLKGIITLPRLQEIVVDNPSGPYLSAILTTVYAPASKNVCVRGYLDNDYSATMFDEVCTPGNNQLKALLGLEDSGLPTEEVPLPITIVVKSSVARIVRSGDAEEREMAFYFHGHLSARIVNLLGQFFLAVPQVPAVDLTIGVAASSWGGAVFDLLPWTRSLRTLSVHDSGVCRSAVKQLGEQTEDAVKGVLTW
ncbi:hypothetical protein FRC01_007731, partial [Tulasnella sp. 417]